MLLTLSDHHRQLSGSAADPTRIGNGRPASDFEKRYHVQRDKLHGGGHFFRSRRGAGDSRRVFRALSPLLARRLSSARLDSAKSRGKTVRSSMKLDLLARLPLTSSGTANTIRWLRLCYIKLLARAGASVTFKASRHEYS